jgi:hypothetical protein
VTPTRSHPRVATALIVAASLFAFLGIFASWVDQQVFDTQEWTDTSTELLQDSAVQQALSTYLVDELYSNVDVAAEIRQALPPAAQGLAAPAAGGLRQVAVQAAVRALEAPRIQEAWARANTAAHKQFLDVIENRGDGAVSTGGGQVTLDLGVLVQNLAERVGLSNLAQKLPPQTGQLEVMKSDDLNFAQTMARVIKNFAFIIPFLWLGLCGLAIYLTPGRRRETLRAAALGFIFAGILVLIVRRFGGNQVVDALATTPSVEDAAHSAWWIGTSLLVEVAQSVILVGTLILIAVWLAGDTRPAVAFRRAVAPYMREQPGLAYGLVVGIYLVLVVWQPVRAFTRPVPLVLIALLMLLGTEALRRRTAREFPDAVKSEGGLMGMFGGRRESPGGNPTNTRSTDPLP